MKQRPDRRTRLLSFRRLRLILLLLALFSLSPSFACVKRQRERPLSGQSAAQTNLAAQTTQTRANDKQEAASPQINSASNQQEAERININTASARELETLPGIGKTLAARIIEHREKYGSFRRPEHLIIVRGISDRRFRALRDLITVE